MQQPNSQQPLGVLPTNLPQGQQAMGAFDGMGVQDLPLPGFGQISLPLGHQS